MKIAIVGAGSVGGTLGRGLAALGHAVTFAVRDPAADKVQRLLREGAGLAAATVAEAVGSAEVVVLATPWGAAQAALQAAGALNGKVLIDCTNPIGPGFSLAVGGDDSGAEQVARWAPGARVCKAFNTTGAENMADPAFGDARAFMPVCGDDDDARRTVMDLAAGLGFEAVDAGPLANARLLEPLAMLWIKLALQLGQGRGIAFGLLRR